MPCTSTGRTRTLLLAAALLACRTAAPAARPQPATPARHAPTAGLATSTASDPSAAFFEAWQRAQSGDPAGAIERLRALDAAGWNVPLDPRDWAGASAAPAFQELAARIAARAPATRPADVAFTVGEPGLVPEGVAVDPATGTLFVGSIRRRKIVRISPRGEATDFVPSESHGLLAPLGLKVDTARGLLWAGSMTSAGMVGFDPAHKGRAALFAFDLATGALRRAVFAPDDGEHVLNDLAIAPDGAVYVTDSTAGGVWKLPPDADRLVPVVPAGRFVYPNGIVLVDAKLLVCDARGITAVPIDAAAGEPRALVPPPGAALGGIDGLSLLDAAADAPRATLVAVQNGLGTPRIVRFVVDPAADRVTAFDVLEAANPRWRVPTTGAVVGDTLLYVGNSHVDGISAEGLTPEAAGAPVLVFRLPLSR